MTGLLLSFELTLQLREMVEYCTLLWSDVLLPSTKKIGGFV